MGSTGNLRFESFTAIKRQESQQFNVGKQNVNSKTNKVEPPDQQSKEPPAPAANHTNIQLSDFVGEHGPYQLSLTLLLFIRYVFLGLMANSGSLMTPDVTFYCRLPMDEVLDIMPNISLLSPTEQELEIREEFKRTCQIDLHLYHNQSNFSPKSFKSPAPSLIEPPTALLATSNNNLTSISTASAPARIRECQDFSYELATDQGRTMTSEFDLVCERDWLRSLFQSLVSGAMTVAHVFWGTFSDKYGRYEAQRLCCIVSLLAGGLSIMAVDFWTFTVARALCSFGDLGLVVSMTTVVVELVGSRYRGLSVALVNFGNALGVALLPYVVAYFEDFRMVVGFTVLCHVVTMPFILTTNESVRWLLSNRRFKRARRELKRIARFNKTPLRVPEQVEVVAVDVDTENKQKEAPKKNPKTSRAEHKRAFEVLFKQFIEQIESQNIIDPYYFDQTAATPTAVKSDIPEIRHSEAPAVVVEFPEQHLLADHPTPAPNGFLRVPECGLKATRSLRSSQEMLKKPDSPETNHNGDDKNNSANSIKSDKGRPRPRATCKRPSIVRAASCSQIDKESMFRHEQTILNVSGLAGQYNGPNCTFKRLTLPSINSQSPSIYDDDDDEDSSDDDDDDDLSQLRALRRQGEGAPAVKQPDCINIVAHQLSFVGRVNRLFRDKKLMIAVFTIVWTTFNSELQYNSFIIINLEVGEDVYLNYILGACMEALAAISACLLLSYATRRHSLITFWLLISLSCFGLSIAHIDSTWAVWCLALAKFSQSCLSSIASVAAYEAFPTFLRQSGSGLVFTLGNLGSVFAPLIFQEFDDHAGMDRVLMTFSASSLTAATLIYLYLNETRDCELQ